MIQKYSQILALQPLFHLFIPVLQILTLKGWVGVKDHSILECVHTRFKVFIRCSSITFLLESLVTTLHF